MEEEIVEAEEQEFYEHFRLEVDKGQSLLRIDKFLMNRMENASRNRIQNAALAGNILVNDKPVKSNYRVKPQDVISIVLAHPPRDTTIYPENIPINIVFEDDDIIIINKEPGMVVHPGYNNFHHTLVHALAYHFENLPNLKGNLSRPGLVHRIDKDTSGLLLVSKNELAMTFLAKQFYDHSITRRYVALVWGDLEIPGTIGGYIGRSLKDRRIMSISNDPEKGKEAITHYEVLERFGFLTMIACKLETGRTHQIRAHMKSIGHPLFSDESYGGNVVLKQNSGAKYKQFIQNCFNIMPRQALHAQSLGFIHPGTRKPILFESELPEDFATVVDKLRSYVAAPIED